MDEVVPNRVVISRRRRLVASLVALGAASALAYLLGVAWRRPANKPPDDHIIDGLAISKAALDLGEVWESPDYECVLPIQNEAGSSIAVQRLLASCTCTQIAPQQFTIAAGQTKLVSLKLDLAWRMPQDLGLEKRPYSVEIWPRHEKSTVQPGWVLHGTIRSRVTLDTLRLQYADQPIHGQAPVSRRIKATVHVPARGLDVEVTPAIATTQVIPRPGSSDEYELQVAPLPSLPSGPFQFKLRVDVIAPDGTRMPGVTIPAAGTMGQEVQPLPSQVLLGSHPLGRTAEADLVLQASAGMDWEVAQIEVDSPDVQVRPIGRKDSSLGRTYRVIQRIAREGDQTSAVRFVLKRPDREPLRVRVNVCYRGEEPAVTATAPKR